MIQKSPRFIIIVDSSINNQLSENNDNPYIIKNEDKRRNIFNIENPYKKKNNADLNVIKELDNDELIKDENKEKIINYNQNIAEINNKNNILNSLCPFKNTEKEKDIFPREIKVSDNDVFKNIQMDNIDAKDKKKEIDNIKKDKENELQIFELNNEININEINMNKDNEIKNKIQEIDENNYDLIKQKKKCLEIIEKENISFEKQLKELNDKYNTNKKETERLSREIRDLSEKEIEEKKIN